MQSSFDPVLQSRAEACSLAQRRGATQIYSPWKPILRIMHQKLIQFPFMFPERFLRRWRNRDNFARVISNLRHAPLGVMASALLLCHGVAAQSGELAPLSGQQTESQKLLGSLYELDQQVLNSALGMKLQAGATGVIHPSDTMELAGVSLRNGVALDVYLDDEGNLTGTPAPQRSTVPTSSSKTSLAKAATAAYAHKTTNKTSQSTSASASGKELSSQLSSAQQAHSVNYGKSVLQLGSKQLLVARLDQNYQLKVAAGKLNNLKLPWQSIIADTTADLALQIRGNSLLVAPHDTQPVVLVVRDQEHPEHTLTLTLLPQSKLESVSLTVVIPELMRDQLLLAQRELHSSAYLGTLTRLMRGMVEQLQAGAIRAAPYPYYSLENFEFFAQEVTPEDLEVVELQLDPTTLQQRFPVVTYNCDWGQLQVRNQHLYQPTNLYYANLRFKLVTLVNQGTTNLEWSFDDCMPPNVVAASLLDHEHLIPAQGTSRLLLLEKLNY